MIFLKCVHLGKAIKNFEVNVKYTKGGPKG